MGNCLTKKIPDVEIKIDGKKCVNLKKLLCCNSECLENDTIISNCCIIQNITNDAVAPPKGQEPKPPQPPVN